MVEQKITKSPELKPIPSDRDGLLRGLVTQTTEVAEKLTTTTFGIVRDVRAEVSHRVGGTLTWIDGAQQGGIKLARTVSDRLDRLSDDVVEAAENLVLGLIRSIRDAARGVTDVAARLTKPREAARAA
jgi:hypothetical protein